MTELSPPVDDPVEYLRGRVAGVFDTANSGRPRWTLTDARMVRVLLDVAERSRGRDASLSPEEWYAARDGSRKVLDGLV